MAAWLKGSWPSLWSWEEGVASDEFGRVRGHPQTNCKKNTGGKTKSWDKLQLLFWMFFFVGGWVTWKTCWKVIFADESTIVRLSHDCGCVRCFCHTIQTVTKRYGMRDVVFSVTAASIPACWKAKSLRSLQDAADAGAYMFTSCLTYRHKPMLWHFWWHRRDPEIIENFGVFISSTLPKAMIPVSKYSVHVYALGCANPWQWQHDRGQSLQKLIF